MGESDEKFLRIQFQHEYKGDSTYPPELEKGLQHLDLPFIGWTKENEKEAIIRHETGPEFIILVTSVIALGTEIFKLFSEWKKKRPETTIQVTVSSAKELEKVLNVLKNQ